MDIVNCPHCNLHAHTKHMHTEIVLCGYCKAPIARNDKRSLQVKLANRPEEFKFDLIGKSFSYRNDYYTITGYIRYFYTEGYLYQWAAYNNRNHIWLCESLGNWFILSEESKNTSIDVPVSTLRPNHNFTYNGLQYTVDALSLFSNYYMEGELPEFPYLHTKGISIECSNQKSLIQFNVYQGNLIDMFVGTSVHINDLKISNA